MASEEPETVVIDTNQVEDVAFIDEDEIEKEVEVDDSAPPPEDDLTDAGLEVVDHSVKQFMGHTDSVFCVAMSPTDEDVVATGGCDDRAFLWRVSSGEELFELGGHDDSVSEVAFSSDGMYVATGGLDGLIGVFLAATGERVITLEGPDEVQFLQWHPKGPVLLAGAADTTVWMWTLPSGQVLQVFSGHASPVTCGAFTPNGKIIVTGAEDGMMHIWNPKTGAATFQVTGPMFHEGPVNNLAINAESVLALTASADSTAAIVQLKTGKVLAKLKTHTDAVEAVGWSNTLPLCATGSMDGTIGIWDTTSYALRHRISHGEGIIKLLWHLTESWVYSSSTDRTVGVFDARNGSTLRMFCGHHDSALDFVTTKDGQTIVTAGDDGVALVFSMLEGGKPEEDDIEGKEVEA